MFKLYEIIVFTWVGLAIFVASLVDVSLGTIRTIATVQGRSRLAFILGFFEITLWLTVISAIVEEKSPIPYLNRRGGGL